VPVILATQEAEKRRILNFEATPAKYFTISDLENTQHKKGLVEWLKW
jgi:hypothetical protein